MDIVSLHIILDTKDTSLIPRLLPPTKHLGMRLYNNLITWFRNPRTWSCDNPSTGRVLLRAQGFRSHWTKYVTYLEHVNEVALFYHKTCATSYEDTVYYFCSQSMIFVCRDHRWFGDHALTNEIVEIRSTVSAGNCITFAGDPKCNSVWVV